MSQDKQSRKWQLVINQPLDKGYDHIRIKEEIGKFKSCIYWCISDEVGAEGTHHTHIFIASTSGIRFSTLKNRFQEAHLEIARGTAQQNRDYIFKEGKWVKDKKHETNLSETHEEWGELPVERPGARNDLSDLYDMIKSGLSNFEIIEQQPDFMFQLDKIERVRQMTKEEEYRTVFRNLEVHYIWGKTGTGKTRKVMEQYGYENVYRISDYDHPYDGYHGQDVIMFEEFRSSRRITEMLTLLDGYPVELPCRYANKIACYTKVYILSNISLFEQYTNVQREEPETWNAFLRRISDVTYYKGKEEIDFCTMTDFSKDGFMNEGQEKNPFVKRRTKNGQGNRTESRYISDSNTQ